MRRSLTMLIGHSMRETINLSKNRRLKQSKPISFQEVYDRIESLDGSETLVHLTRADKEDSEEYVVLTSHPVCVELNRNFKPESSLRYCNAWLQVYRNRTSDQVFIDVISGKVQGRGVNEVKSSVSHF